MRLIYYHRDGTVTDVDVPEEPTRLTPIEFMDRMSVARQVEIMQAAQANPMVLLWIMKLTGASYVDVTAQDTIDGVNALQAAGLLTEVEAAALLA